MTSFALDMPQPPRLLRITTVSISLKLLLRGQLSFFQKHGFEVLTASAHGPEVKDLVAGGVPHHSVPMTRAITPLHDLLCLWQLVTLIRKFKPDIVHTHTPKAGLLGMIAAWICRVPVRLHTVAGLPMMEATGWRRWVLHHTERLTYAAATKVYPNSLGLLRFMMTEFKIPESQIQSSDSTFNSHSRLTYKNYFEIGTVKYEIIGKGSSNGVDPYHFSRSREWVDAANQIRSLHQIPEGAMVFGFVGRVVKDKGIVELVEAFQRLAADADIWLLLVGPYEQALDPLPETVRQAILEDPRIIKAGFQSDVRPWLVATNVFVFPSYREGFPNVVMQASCLEVPCIVSDINGCNEIIEDQANGLIVPPKDSQALYEAMKIMMGDKALRRSFALLARAYVIENFDQHYVWNELLREYRELLSLTR